MRLGICPECGRAVSLRVDHRLRAHGVKPTAAAVRCAGSGAPAATDAQLDGRACIRCGRDDQAMAPTGTRSATGVQLFVCSPACPGDTR